MQQGVQKRNGLVSPRQLILLTKILGNAKDILETSL